jgi:DNA-binding NtrC family response regulator
LRTRGEDILTLAAHFLTPLGKRLDAEATERLLRHHWPGNVRELRNALQRAAVLARGDTLGLADFAFLAAPASAENREEIDLPAAVAQLEARMIARALAETGNRAEAARRLGIHRQLLYAKIRRYGLSDDRTDGVCDPDAPEGNAGTKPLK